MLNHMIHFLNEEEGATALEYGLLAALIAASWAAIISSMPFEANVRSESN